METTSPGRWPGPARPRLGPPDPARRRPVPPGAAQVGSHLYQDRQTWLRGPSAISLERHARENRGEGTVAASLCVYDDDRFLESLVEDLLPRLRHLIISHATAPWFGTGRGRPGF